MYIHILTVLKCFSLNNFYILCSFSHTKSAIISKFHLSKQEKGKQRNKNKRHSYI